VTRSKPFAIAYAIRKIYVLYKRWGDRILLSAIMSIVFWAFVTDVSMYKRPDLPVGSCAYSEPALDCHNTHNEKPNLENST